MMMLLQLLLLTHLQAWHKDNMTDLQNYQHSDNVEMCWMDPILNMLLIKYLHSIPHSPVLIFSRASTLFPQYLSDQSESAELQLGKL